MRSSFLLPHGDGFTMKRSVSGNHPPLKRCFIECFSERAIRHVPFNVQAFLNVAVQAAGANECISFKKVEEGEKPLL
jgi:hypothetical protein